MRIKQGTVTSAKMQKTIVVTVHGYRTHPKYKKQYRVTKKFMAHDEAGACKEGEKVTIIETRPLSRNKRWRVIGAEELTKLSAEQKVRREAMRHSAQLDDMLTALIEPRKRTKTRGQRLKENEEASAAPSPSAATTEAAAPAEAKKGEKPEEKKGEEKSA